MPEASKRFGLTSRSFLFAVLIHLALLALLGVSLHWKSPVIKPGVVKPIQAMAIPEAQIQQQMAELERQEQQKVADEQAAQQRLEELEQKRQQEEERLHQVEEQRKQEEQKKQEVEEQRKLEEQKKAETEKLRIEEEKKRVVAEKRRKEEEEKKRQVEAEKERLAAEQKKKEEAERKRKEEEKKKQEAAEQKKKEEAERKRKAEEAERKKALQERVAQEQLKGEAIRALGEIDWRIKEAIQQNWRRPATSQTGLTARVLIQVTAGGDVINARVTQSSGDPYFDHSAEVAVMKASPLPLPADPRYRDIYRQESIEIFFNPDG